MSTKKRARHCHDSAIVDVWKRELGQLSSRNFANRLAASEDLVLRFDILRKLDVHRGCVNTVSFNASGDILVSGSDDKRIVLWDWETGQVILSFHSDHSNNVFQAKFMPYTEDKRIVTCAADGQVRFAQISEGRVVTKLLAEHQGRVHKLAVEPGSPHILYTCGEDGLVQHIDMRTESATRLFTCQPFRSHNFFHAVHLNAITIDPRNPNLFAIGGLDPFARLYDIRRYKWDGSSNFGQPVDFFCPMHLTDDENVGITGLAFSEQSELLVSYNDELIYLFTKDLGLASSVSDAGNMTPDNFPGSSLSNVDGDVKAAPQAYKGHRNSETVKGAGFFGPKCEYVVSGSDCGRIFIWNKKGGRLVRVMEADKHVVNCIESHPHSTVLASSGIEHDIKIWIPKAIDRAILPTNIQKDSGVSSIRHRFHLFTFGGFYDDGDDDGDFICLDDNDNNDDDEDEDEYEDDYEDEDDSDNTSGSDDDDDDDDDDEEEEDEDGNCDNKDYVTENHDDHRGNEVQNEQLEGEENNDGTDFNSVGNSDDNGDCSSDTSLYNDMDDSVSDNDVDTVNAASDDSFLDTCDISNYSDFDCSDSDFDD